MSKITPVCELQDDNKSSHKSPDVWSTSTPSKKQFIKLPKKESDDKKDPKLRFITNYHGNSPSPLKSKENNFILNHIMSGAKTQRKVDYSE